ncbi:MAG: DUF6884 domain-containing protein [Pontixanthobacter sp.]
MFRKFNGMLYGQKWADPAFMRIRLNIVSRQRCCLPTRVALVSCVKQKRNAAAPARDLYLSQLFRGLRQYAETHADVWYILSAEYGILRPEQVVEPYERTLNTMPKQERLTWAEKVQQQLLGLLPSDAEVILLAGQRYRVDIEPFLRKRGHAVSIPLEGLQIGKQLQRLKQASK